MTERVEIGDFLCFTRAHARDCVTPVWARVTWTHHDKRSGSGVIIAGTSGEWATPGKVPWHPGAGMGFDLKNNHTDDLEYTIVKEKDLTDEQLVMIMKAVLLA